MRLPAESATHLAHHLIAAVTALSRTRSAEEIQDIVKRAARRIADADGATFVLRDSGQCFYVDEDAIGPLWKGLKFPMSLCVSGYAMNNRTAVRIDDIELDDRVPIDAYRRTFVKSLSMVPIRQNDPIGAIGVYWGETGRASTAPIEALQALADATSVAIENVNILNGLAERVRAKTQELEGLTEQLRREVEIRRHAEEIAAEAAIKDELTGLLNRRGLMLVGGELLATARRIGSALALCYLDLDRFKQVNDRYGHETGDRMLQAFGGALVAATRESDTCARLGGDEFVVLAMTSDPLAFTRLLSVSLQNRLSNLFEKHDFNVSLGSITIDPSDVRSLGALLSAADRQMYAKKKRGELTETV
jgi:diguanylate cyclase (GGDEF)-like protein